MTIQIHVNKTALLVAVMLILCAVLLVGRGGAVSAVFTDYEVVIGATEPSEDDLQDLTVSCPEGKVAIGGGVGIYWDNADPTDLRPVLISSFMYPDNTGWYGEAVQPGAATTEWWIEVQVICAVVG